MSQLLELSAARDKSFFKNGACRDEFCAGAVTRKSAFGAECLFAPRAQRAPPLHGGTACGIRSGDNRPHRSLRRPIELLQRFPSPRCISPTMHQQPNSPSAWRLYAIFAGRCKVITNVAKWGRRRPLAEAAKSGECLFFEWWAVQGLNL
jgi:hypothetical protein